MSSYNDLVKKIVKEYGFSDIEALLSGNYGTNLIQDFIYDLVLEAQKECLKRLNDEKNIIK